MRTNRDFYDYVVALPHTKRPLADYLRALQALVMPYRGDGGLALDVFADLLREAMTAAPAKAPPDDPNEFERLLWRQVGDLPGLPLHDAAKIYFGTDSKVSGARWYNAHVNQFLECGAEGAFHGYLATGEDLEDIAWLDWEALADFLVFGQTYE